jgi:hypothetical protein
MPGIEWTDREIDVQIVMRPGSVVGSGLSRVVPRDSISLARRQWPGHARRVGIFSALRRVGPGWGWGVSGDRSHGVSDSRSEENFFKHW